MGFRLMRIELVIDELVLIGFDPRDRYRIADALERELASQVQSGNVERVARGARALKSDTPLRAPDVTLHPTSARPSVMARDISRSIVGALSQGNQQTSQREGR